MPQQKRENSPVSAPSLSEQQDRYFQLMRQGMKQCPGLPIRCVINEFDCSIATWRIAISHVTYMDLNCGNV